VACECAVTVPDISVLGYIYYAVRGGDTLFPNDFGGGLVLISYDM